MKLEFKGDISALQQGIEYLKDELDMQLSMGGLTVDVIENQENMLEIYKQGKTVKLSYGKPVHFFRALSLLKENEKYEDFRIVQHQQFDQCGVMIDVSQGNSVINMENIKNIIRRIALMGLDMIMLYCEDSYVIASEPYFGYMRGKYSFNELKTIDEYAFALGIEAVPCIQTLAHLFDALRWPRYNSIREDEDTLLVGDEETYKFIDRMITAASGPFKTKRIHIGMDEAWKLGQGTYLLKNGYKPKYQIMKEHLDRVLEITRKHGLKPVIWCDMYFRSIANNLYHLPDIALPQELIDSVPVGVELMGWEYYQFGAENYDRFLAQHKKLQTNVAMAGGIWSWMGYAAEYDMTFLTSNYLLNSAKKIGIRQIIATVWGDFGTESNVYSALLGMQLFAEHNYSQDEPSRDVIKSRFKVCTGCEFDDFYEFTYIDKYNRELNPEGYRYVNSSKALMWQDILMGLFDKNFEDIGFELGEYYKERAARMQAAIGRNGEYDGVFRFMELFCSVLEIKADAGLKLYKAYKCGDFATLENYVMNLLPELIRRVKDLKEYHYCQWMKINKPFGWEVLDIRYGGLIARIYTVIKRLNAYLHREIDKIEELEEDRLYYNGKPGIFSLNEYQKIVSASRL